MNEQDIIELVKKDSFMMAVLTKAQELDLPNWIIGAGFLRNKVWDYLHGMQNDSVDTNDIDLIYFDLDPTKNEAYDIELSKNLKDSTGFNWEIVNQVYTANWHNRGKSYVSSTEALSEWIETATCVGITMKDGVLSIVSPHGISDLVELKLRPNASAYEDYSYVIKRFNERFSSKDWLKKWPKLKIVG